MAERGTHAWETALHVHEMAHPGDVSGLAGDLAAGTVAAADIVAVLAKTEGNGLDNDHSRAFATLALEQLLGPALGVPPESVGSRMTLMLSGGVEGATNPAMYVFVRRLVDVRPDPTVSGLAIGRAVGRALPPEAIGTMAQVEATAEALTEAARSMGLDSPAEIAFAICKAPVLTDEKLADAARRGVHVAADGAHASKPATRAATALGVALALGEVPAEALAGEAIGKSFDLYSSRCCVTPAIDCAGVEVLALANRPGWGGGLSIAGGAMADMLDAPAVVSCLSACDLTGTGMPQLDSASRARLKLIVVKGEPPRSGRLRGRRHVMWRDSDVHALRWFRASMMGLLSSLTGDTRAYIAAGAEHQGPAEGGTIAVIAERAR